MVLEIYSRCTCRCLKGWLFISEDDPRDARRFKPASRTDREDAELPSITIDTVIALCFEKTMNMSSILQFRCVCVAVLLLSAQAQVSIPDETSGFDPDNVQLMNVDLSRGYYCDG